jgi:hypothetical protein
MLDRFSVKTLQFVILLHILCTLKVLLVFLISIFLQRFEEKLSVEKAIKTKIAQIAITPNSTLPILLKLVLRNIFIGIRKISYL